MAKSTEGSLAWLAGIIDGEGSIGLHAKVDHRGVKREPYYRARLRIVSADKRIVLETARIFRECVHIDVKIGYDGRKTSRRRPHIYYSINVTRLETLLIALSTLVPYLISKKEEALLLLEFLKGHKKRSPHNGNSRIIAEALKVLKGSYKIISINEELGTNLGAEGQVIMQ